MDHLFALIHELALERGLGRQVECVQEVLLTVLVYFARVIQHFDSLLLLEGQIFLDCFRDLKACEDSCVALMVQLLIVVLVLAVCLLRDRQITFLAELSVALEHPVLAVCNDWIEEARDVHAVPGFAKDDIAQKDLVFERRTERPWLCIFFHNPFDASSDARDSLDTRPCELGYLHI